MEDCYFCESDKTDSFAEHYILCKKCTAVYTFVSSKKGSSIIIEADIPTVMRLPYYKLTKDKPFIKRKEC